MQGLVQFSIGRMWADSYLLWSSTIYLQHSNTGEGCLLYSHHHHNFCASYHRHLATLASHSFRFKQATWQSCFEGPLSNQCIGVQKLLRFPHLAWLIEGTFKLHRNIILKMFNQNRNKSAIANNIFKGNNMESNLKGSLWSFT